MLINVFELVLSGYIQYYMLLSLLEIWMYACLTENKVFALFFSADVSM